MMINKRLIGTVSESKKYVAGNVAFQWCSLAANIMMMTSITKLLASLFLKTADRGERLDDGGNCRLCRHRSFRVHGRFKQYGLSFLQGGEKDVAGEDLPEAS